MCRRYVNGEEIWGVMGSGGEVGRLSVVVAMVVVFVR